jgi:phage protein D
MAREKETRVWSDARRSDAVSDVLQRHFPRNKIDVEATDKILESITQRGEHDWQFCQRQAQLAQYDLFIDEDGAHFIKPRRGESPARTLRYVDNPINAGHIIDFNHDGVGKGLPGKITLKGRDPVTKKSFSISVTPDTADDIGELVEPAWVETPEEGDENERGDAGQEITRNTGAKTEAEARELATSMLKAARWSAMELSLTLLGDPTVRSRRVVAVWGLGQSMDGLWWSTEVQHTLGRGYVTKVKLAREGLAKRLAPAAVKAARKAKKEIEDAAATAMGALYGYTQGY